MNLLDISEQRAKELFPHEKWTEIYKNVFVAQSRKPINSEQKKVFEKELGMAKIASDNSHVVFLLPENAIEKNKKNPDSVLDGMLTEFKNVIGDCILLLVLRKEDVLLEHGRFKIIKALTNQCPSVAPGWNSRTRTITIYNEMI